MKSYYSICITLLLFGLAESGLKAQIQFKTYFDVGETNVSEGVYANTSLLGSLKIGKTKLDGGTV